MKISFLAFSILLFIVKPSLSQSLEWKAIGIGVYGNYAVVWFGEVEDK